MRFFATIFEYVNAKLDNVTVSHLKVLRLGIRLAETLIVDKCTVTASGILWIRLINNDAIKIHTHNLRTYPNVKLSVGIPQNGMIAGQHLTFENAIVVVDSVPGYWATDFHFYIWFQKYVTGLKWENENLVFAWNAPTRGVHSDCHLKWMGIRLTY